MKKEISCVVDIYILKESIIFEETKKSFGDGAMN